ncbi:MAG: hypothetical protein QOG68_937 [Solirubrobacteraceae bacterium]|nr:hypothetical protein [Solirubrobacteraceae bacterium]
MPRRVVQAAFCALLIALSAPPAAQAITAATLKQKLVDQSQRLGTTSGAYVRDLDTGRLLYARKADTPRAPASNEKLLTTATALMQMGPAAQFRTVLKATARPVDGVIKGDVVLIGSGDPYLTAGQLRLIANRLVALGVTEITGKVLGDGTYLDRLRGSYDSGYAYDSDIGGSLGGLVADEGRGANPALYAATRLRDALLAADIVVRKGAHSGILGSRGVELANVASVPLSTTILRINVPSDNFAAELLLKDIGAGFGSSGSTAAGATVVQDTLEGIGVKAVVHDGSGLSRADQVSPHQLVSLLAAMNDDPDAGLAFRSSLPVAGRTGTLAKRMRGTKAQGRCFAKTGTLDGVSALTGYCAAANADTIAFSFIENNMDANRAKDVEDHMVPQIARFTG